MHNLAVRSGTAPRRFRGPAVAPVAPAPASAGVRAATWADVAAIATLVNGFAAERLMLPRTEEQVAAELPGYVVVGRPGHVLACAALTEYSPSLAEVSSVAVAREAQGRGLGGAVVLGVERLAARRDIHELFALSLADGFFASLGYTQTAIARYPEKLARYDVLRARGVEIVPKPCWMKVLAN